MPNPSGKTSIELREIPLKFQPGEQWEYNNVGYAVLGHLIEQVSGQSYADFVQENIFKPLVMNDSGFDSNVTIIPHRASGYVPGANGPENAERTDLSLAFSAGAVYSTAEDLLLWEQGLLGGKLLTSASLQKMTTPFKNDYACGLYVKRVNGHLIVEHSGDVIGFNTDMAYYPEEKLAVIVLGNLNSPAVGKITTALAAVMHGESVSLDLPKEIALSKEVLARHAGTYEFEGFKIVITLEGGHLVASGGPNQRTFVLFAESETQFHRKVIEEQWEFSKNDKGEFAFVTLHQDGRDMKGQKQKIGQ